MTEIEETLAALMIDVAKRAESKKFQGSLTSLREMTETTYRLDAFEGAFETALEFLEEHKFARTHKYNGVENYVSIDVSGSTKSLMLSFLPKAERPLNAPFSMSDPPPRYPIIDSYLDVGSAWLHDFALSLRDKSPGPTSSAIDSASWTGRIVISIENRVRFNQVVEQMRNEIESLELSNSDRSNALSAIKAIQALNEAADPPWALILKILRSPVLANLTALAALAVSLIRP